MRRSGGRSGDQTPPPHAANSPADKSGPASAVWGVGGILAEKLENSPQRKRRGLREEKDWLMSSQTDIKALLACPICIYKTHITI